MSGEGDESESGVCESDWGKGRKGMTSSSAAGLLGVLGGAVGSLKRMVSSNCGGDYQISLFVFAEG